MGDNVLRYIGDVLRKNLRSVDVPSRYGGDEFLLILSETDFTGAKVVAEKLWRFVAYEDLPKELPNDPKFTISLGIAVYPYDGENRDRLIKAADVALYMAKGAGKNCWRAYATVMESGK